MPGMVVVGKVAWVVWEGKKNQAKGSLVSWGYGWEAAVLFCREGEG